MTRRGEEAPALFDAPKHRPGRHERHAEAAVRHARAAGRLEAIHEAAASTMRGLGRAADVAEAKSDPYAWAAVSRELRAWHADLGLLPDGTTDDPLDALLAGLGTPEHPAAPVRDTARP